MTKLEQRLRDLLKRSEWAQKTTTLRNRSTITTVNTCWCCGAHQDINPNHLLPCDLRMALEATDVQREAAPAGEVREGAGGGEAS